MKDLTRGSIVSHILSMAPPIVVGMITIMICQLVDLYFVSGLGEAAIAGVAAAGNAGFLVNALMQVLGVGTVALMAHAVGRKDRGDANLVFNQSVVLSVLFGILTLVAGFALSRPYMRAVAADEATVEAGTVYLLWFMPALALQFATQVMASALRATGIVRPSMLVQALAVVINIALAPVLITGWGTGHALGVAGAGLASSIAVFVGVLMLLGYFLKLERYVAFHPEQWRPQLRQWKRILNVGLPAGGEFAMIFIIMAVGYYVLSIFGPAAQAGFGIGTRLLGLIQMPALAIALAAGPIAGQNFGAGNGARVRETFVKSSLIATAVMIVFMILAQFAPGLLLAGFSRDHETMAVASLFLRLVSLNMVAQGLIFTCSSMFQGLGNTKPVLWASATRVLTYSLPSIWLSTWPGFRMEHVWYLSIATTTLQAALSVWLLLREFRKRLELPAQEKVAKPADPESVVPPMREPA
ncbi:MULTISPECIES: MATE family efflux transporter [Bradyrhizobium]|uniref:MATE family efflux transporter n=1 Tax=Bradyrhizobium TaxID=374 RepID=UPI00040774CB|nr:MULTISPECIES: MATE family efflux transporter [Bradyrhizobium]MBR1002784.1 MATE family efflux transporter [Bradyrhizobium liaoningense]MCP1744556.1 putative MATE family efflux protein [Bradyrhizobium japonicum]MCP1862186.1 putative MATE family efflux protein [Bradyrhizobium japonicum]MCP1893028.1 putative MATE family efflux protein [Bradyrhizobium japonicum]MCW2326153.1 putative MATE family efflux protein [Bradyrhizobium japonicum]